jgi:hypothetical protein
MLRLLGICRTWQWVDYLLIANRDPGHASRPLAALKSSGRLGIAPDGEEGR